MTQEIGERILFRILLIQAPFKKSSSRDVLVTDQDPILPPSINQGKVRQLFLERRGGKGWDRSYPLEPLKNKRNTNSDHPTENQTKSLSNLTDNTLVLSQTLPDKAFFFKKLPNIGGTMQSKSSESSSAPPKKRISRIPQLNNERLKSPTANITRDIKKVAISPRKPLADDIPVKPSSTESRKSGTHLKKDEEKPRTPKTIVENKNSTSNSSTPNKPRTPLVSAPKNERNVLSTPTEKVRIPQNSNPDQPQCKICGRSFAADRIEKHEQICKQTKTKKRKVFDPVKQRVAGTEAEAYVKKAHTQKNSQPPAPPKADWRKKHEEFIANIRAAKQVKDHLAKGGKLSDLPPPPPLDTSDYVSCPHCGRKFSQGAAERHIPICKNMKHNKPKKNAKK